MNGLIDAINLFQRSLVETTEEEITDSHETERNKGALGLIDSENDTKDTCICQNNHTVIFQDIDSLPTLKMKLSETKPFFIKNSY